MRKAIIFNVLLFLTYLNSFSYPYQFDSSRKYSYTCKKDIVYKTITESFAGLRILDFKKELKIDIYLPYTNPKFKRPLILFIHGGAFIKGNKNDKAIKFLCEDFATRGFVTASVDYRLFELGEKPNTYRLMYKAAQDANDALNYLTENADSFNISTNYFFVGGISAGAITALNSVYWQNSKNPCDINLQEDYGSIIFPNNKIKGIISISGAIPTLDFINNQLKCPVLSFHGINDDTVKIEKGEPSFRINTIDIVEKYNNAIHTLQIGSSILPNLHKLIEGDLRIHNALIPVLYGPKALHQKLNELGIYNNAIYFVNMGHTLCQKNDVKLPTYYVIVDSTLLFLNNLIKSPAITKIYGYANNEILKNISTYYVDSVVGYNTKWNIKNGSIINQENNSVTVLWDTIGDGKVEVSYYNELGNQGSFFEERVLVVNDIRNFETNKAQGIFSLINFYLIALIIIAGIVIIMFVKSRKF